MPAADKTSPESGAPPAAGDPPAEDPPADPPAEDEVPKDPTVTILQGFHLMKPPAGLSRRPYNAGEAVTVPESTRKWMEGEGYLTKPKPYQPPKLKGPRGRAGMRARR